MYFCLDDRASPAEESTFGASRVGADFVDLDVFVGHAAEGLIQDLFPAPCARSARDSAPRPSIIVIRTAGCSINL
jgi:hypothetical protein